MQHYKSIQKLIENYKRLLDPGRIYVEGNKKSNYTESLFWVLSSKEAKDQDLIETKYGTIPQSLVEFKASSFLDVATFQDIIDNKLDNKLELSVNDAEIMIDAINYYLVNDDFED